LWLRSSAGSRAGALPTRLLRIRFVGIVDLAEDPAIAAVTH
jgi:hypothetical protein